MQSLEYYLHQKLLVRLNDYYLQDFQQVSVHYIYSNMYEYQYKLWNQLSD